MSAAQIVKKHDIPIAAGVTMVLLVLYFAKAISGPALKVDEHAGKVVALIAESIALTGSIFALSTLFVFRDQSEWGQIWGFRVYVALGSLITAAAAALGLLDVFRLIQFA